MMDASGIDLLEKSSEQEAIAQARAEERRQSAIQLVNSIYRLIKVLGIHAESNQAVAVLVSGTVAAVQEYCGRSGAASASVLFADDTIFVNGQMLRASREAYGTAVALGALFVKCGISEVTFQASLDASQAMEFARVLHATLRDRGLAASIVERPLTGVKLRRIDGRTKDGEVEEVPLTERVARTYAASIVIMRAFYTELAGGELKLPHRIKRVAQKLVKDAEEAPHVLLSLAAARGASTDEAGIAVSSAALAILIAQKLTNDRALLGNVATTALLFDVGRPRLESGGELGKAGVVRVLNDNDLDRLPASTAFVHSVLGRMHTASITRTVVSFEALWARRMVRLGPVYGGRRTPTMLSRLLAVTRTFTELVTPTKAAPALAVDEAVHLMMDTAASEIDRACVKLLVATLGFFPVGTVVELNTGELAIVTAVPSLPSEFVKPKIRLMYDESGGLLPEPLDLDLSRDSAEGQPARYVRRTIEYDAHQMRAMRSFVLATVAGNRPAQHPALLRPTSEPVPEPSASEPSRTIDPAKRTPAPRTMTPGSVPSPSGPATRQVDWQEYQKLATPPPRIIGAPPPAKTGPATRQVDWQEYQKLATPQPRVVAAPPPSPSGPATRQVDWNEYQKLATPQPRIVGRDTPEPVSPKTRIVGRDTPEPASSKTRAVSWDEYEKLATPQPRIVGAPASEPPTETRAVSWDDYQRLATPPPPPSIAEAPLPDATTRAISWDDQDIDIEPFDIAESLDEIPVEQDDTDLLLAGVIQDDEQPAASTDEVDSLFKDYLFDDPKPAPEPEPQPMRPSPTRHLRWAATEALLSEIEEEKAKAKPPTASRPLSPRPLPPRPEPKRR